MTTFNKFNQFAEDLAKGVHNLSSGAITVCLTDTAPVAGNKTLSDLTPISMANLSSRACSITSCVQTSGVLKLVLADLVLTASGTVPQFRYVVLYNDTPTSPADPLIGWYDYGQEVNLNSGDTFTIDFDQANGVLTLT